MQKVSDPHEAWSGFLGACLVFDGFGANGVDPVITAVMDKPCEFARGFSLAQIRAMSWHSGDHRILLQSVQGLTVPALLFGETDRR